MILKIHNTKTVGELKMKFAECFPYLKLEVYYRSHKWNEGTRAQFLVPSDKTLGEVRRNYMQGDMDVKSWNKTGEVERALKEKFGLNVQVFRRYKSGWIQSTKTDGLTLKEQSDIASKTVDRICVPE
jgi:hypothetical protein